jgi:hypothetical protein
MATITAITTSNRGVGKANGSRECAPDGVPTKTFQHKRLFVLSVGTAQRAYEAEAHREAMCLEASS